MPKPAEKRAGRARDSRPRRDDSTTSDCFRAGRYALASWYRDFCAQQGRRPAELVALTSEPDREACREFGIAHCFPKPLTAEQCQTILPTFLSRIDDATNDAPADDEPMAMADE